MSLDGSEDKSVTYSYDALGRKDIVTYPNGATVDYDYEDNKGGWVQKITHKDGSDALILSLTYTRDDAGTIDEVVEDRGEANTEYKWVYTYDGLKRLTDASFTTLVNSSQTAQTVYEYTYDRRGNRLSKTVDLTTTDFVYNDLDQLVSETTGANSKTYTWDKFGRLASETDGSDSRAYTWSVDERMLSVTIVDNDNTLAVNYTYNHQGDRVGQVAQGNNGSGTPVDVDKLFLADRNNLTGYSQSLAEVDGKSGDLLKNYVYGSDHAPLAQSDLGGTPDFFHSDHLGTTRALTTSSGNASLIQEYEPYGIPSNSALSSLTSQYFTGQYRDGYTGLQYHRARWLDTGQGRWYSQDPVFDFPGNFGNGYGCTSSNFINYIDISGLLTLSEVLQVAGMVSILSLVLFSTGFKGGESLAIRRAFSANKSTGQKNVLSLVKSFILAADFGTSTEFGELVKVFPSFTKNRYIANQEYYFRTDGISKVYLSYYGKGKYSGVAYPDSGHIMLYYGLLRYEKDKASAKTDIHMDKMYDIAGVFIKPKNREYKIFELFALYEQAMMLTTTLFHEVLHLDKKMKDENNRHDKIYVAQYHFMRELHNNPSWQTLFEQHFQYPLVPRHKFQYWLSDVWKDIIGDVNNKAKPRIQDKTLFSDGKRGNLN